MSSLAPLHPIIVHFVVALLVVGVVFRLISLTGRFAFTGPAAATLLIAGTVAAVFAVSSGDAAHSKAERIPGAGEMVEEHEEWGERTRNLFLVVGIVEIVALFGAAAKVRKPLLVLSGVIGVVGLLFVYETAEHGGELVYSYAGGVGTRTGDPADIERLLTAGLYHQADQDRAAGREEDAARLMELLALRHPDDVMIQVLAARSILDDRHDVAGALAAAHAIVAPPDNRRARFWLGTLKADVYEAAGFPDSARDAIEALLQDFPDNRRLKRRLAEMN